MPDEPNQYSFNGSYIDYFADIFSKDFAEYRVERESVRGGRATVFTLWSGSRRALVVELMSENSSSKKLRSQCASDRIPYLRFYYDHHGWWNTRSYVVARVRKALS